MTEYLPLMSYCFVMSVTPGPNNVMLATTGANFGGRGAWPVIVGIQAGLFLQTLLMCAGLGQLFTAYPMAQQALRVGGALYLIYLAWKLSGAAGAAGQPTQAPKPLSLAQAALFQALNPKSWIKAITMASVFLPAGPNAVANALLVAVIGAMVGTPCNLMWALFGVAIRHLLHDPARRRVFNLTMGATLVILALMFLR